MDLDTARALLLACHDAARVDAYLPELPAGVAPRHVRALGAVVAVGSDGVSAVADRLRTTRPSVTRTIGELEALGLVTKSPAAGDGRRVVVTPTQAGLALHERYDVGFHAGVARTLGEIPDDDVTTTLATLERVRALLEANQSALLPEGPTRQER